MGIRVDPSSGSSSESVPGFSHIRRQMLLKSGVATIVESTTILVVLVVSAHLIGFPLHWLMGVGFGFLLLGQSLRENWISSVALRKDLSSAFTADDVLNVLADRGWIESQIGERFWLVQSRRFGACLSPPILVEERGADVRLYGPRSWLAFVRKRLNSA